MISISRSDTGIGPTLDGRNSEGDPYYTDVEIEKSVLVKGSNQRSATVAGFANTPLVDLKNRAWRTTETLLMPNP